MTAARVARWASRPVLVVDDHADGRDLIVEYLQFEGFTVHAAATGAAALALASRFRPRVILMDLAMADLDGLETTRCLRANVTTKDAIIVAVTARAFPHDREAAHRAGCDAFITKPFDVTTLPAYLDRLVSSDIAPRTSPDARSRRS